MKCKNCGLKMEENSKFCSNCGAKNEMNVNDEKTEVVNEDIKSEIDVNNNEIINNIQDEFNNDTKQSKKKWIIIILGILIAAIGIGSIVIISQNIKNTDKIIEKIDKEMLTFSNYIIDDFEQDILDIENKRTELNNDKDREKASLLLEQVEDLVNRMQTSNEEYLNGIIDNLAKSDLTRAYDEELKTIENYEIDVKKLISDHKYLDALSIVEPWQNLIEEINVIHDNYEILINQVDANNYPTIRLYLSIVDKYTGEVVKNIDPNYIYLSEKSASDTEFLKQTIKKFSMLDEKEALNTNLVADVSDSMNGTYLDTAKVIMSDFLSKIQFDVNDKVELTTFADNVIIAQSFTTDRYSLLDQINYMDTYGMTALYDALFAAVNSTAAQGGAKCVIAFTDGADNMSIVSPNTVIEYANRYKVPIFIVGLGNQVDSNLSRVASATNGYYKNVNDINELLDFYQGIYRQTKEMYIVEYDVNSNNHLGNVRDIMIDIQTRENGGTTDFSFEPIQLISSDVNIPSSDPITQLLKDYLYNYTMAINNHDYSYIEQYLVPGGGVEKEVKPYILKNIQEELLAFEMISQDFKSDDICIVSTRETYKVQNNEEPLHMRVLQGKYVLEKQSNGLWKIKDFADLYKILSKINY